MGRISNDVRPIRTSPPPMEWRCKRQFLASCRCRPINPAAVGKRVIRGALCKNQLEEAALVGNSACAKPEAVLDYQAASYRPHRRASRLDPAMGKHSNFL